MSRRNPSITAALCVSLIAHGLGLSAIAWWVVANTPAPKLAAIDKVRVLLSAMPKTDLTHPPAPTPPPKPTPQAEKKKPVKFEKPLENHKDDSGEANGIGTANRSTDGSKPMLANAGLEQADLMKPADQFDDRAFLPASKGAVKGNDAQPQKTARTGEDVHQPQPEKSPPGVGPLPADPSTVTPLTTAGEQHEPKPTVPVANASTPKPVEKEIRGHKATVSDTESVAMAKEDSLTFRAGKLEGRKGLRVKTTVPRLGFASEIELANLPRLHLVLGVTVDNDGNPQDVEVIESSGSANVDQDYKNEVYNHWNLEPKKDKDGHPIDLNWVINVE